MADINPDTLWFSTPDTFSLCRGGGNGPKHPSQLYAITKYVEPGMSFLDYGCGSATTYEAILTYRDDKGNSEFSESDEDQGGNYTEWITLKYLGVDIIPKNIEWCERRYPAADFEVNPSLHKIDQPDQSWDVVYSRHVVDHMESFEGAMDEHIRVATKMIIVVLWRPLGDGDEHQIKHIVDQGKVYENEYTNDYSRKKVMEWIESKKPEWELLELAEGVGKEVKGFDTVIVLKRKP